MADCCKPRYIDKFLCEWGHSNEACVRYHFSMIACGILCDVFPAWMPPLLVTPPPPDPPWWEIFDSIVQVFEKQGFTPMDPQQFQKVKVEALTEFRKGFEEVVKRLDKEIESIS